MILKVVILIFKQSWYFNSLDNYTKLKEDPDFNVKNWII
jgi:hypothetical protein